MAVLSAILVALPQAVSSWWGFFSSEPLADWLARQNIPILAVSPLWITGPVGTALLAAILWKLRPASPAAGEEERTPKSVWDDLPDIVKRPLFTAEPTQVAPRTVHRPQDQVQRILKQVDQRNADQRAGAIERARKDTKRNEVLDRVGELIRERKCRESNVLAIRQNMFGVLIQAGAHRLETEEDVVMVCNDIVAAGNEHPFQMFDRENSPVDKGEWLDFIRAFHVSGMPFEDTSGWSLAVTRWRGKDRWLNRSHSPMRTLGVTDEEVVVEQEAAATLKASEILALTKGRTTLQANEILQPYQRKLIETNGDVRQLHELPSGELLLIIRDQDTGDMIGCRFDAQWHAILSDEYSDIGKHVELCGKLLPKQTGVQMQLQECELKRPSSP